MYVGTQDPLLGSSPRELDEQLKAAEQKLAALQEISRARRESHQSQSPIWDAIDKEIEPLTPEQSSRLQGNSEYMELYTRLNSLVQAALLDMVRGTVEKSEEGKAILEAQLKLIRELKGKIIEDTNREMELFRRFREFSSSNPGATYEEFLKTL